MFLLGLLVGIPIGALLCVAWAAFWLHGRLEDADAQDVEDDLT